jgi:hypothetical protein
MRMALGPYISAASLMLCSLLALNWTRSYNSCEFSNRFDEGVVTVFGSNKGTMYFIQEKTAGRGHQEWKHHSTKPYDRKGNDYDLEWTLQKKKIVLPYRIVVPLVALIGVAPWVGKRSLNEAAILAIPHIPGIIEGLC